MTQDCNFDEPLIDNRYRSHPLFKNQTAWEKVLYPRPHDHVIVIKSPHFCGSALHYFHIIHPGPAMNGAAEENGALPREESTSNVAHTTTITFLPGDPLNPRTFPAWRTWSIVASITLIDLTISWGASGFSPASEDFDESLHVGTEVGVLGLSLYVLGLALGPMTLAPLSEYHGCTALYVVPYGVFVLFLLGTVQNLGGFLVLRILSGMFARVTIANFGGDHR